jgi:hypothetical protein
MRCVSRSAVGDVFVIVDVLLDNVLAAGLATRDREPREVVAGPEDGKIMLALECVLLAHDVSFLSHLSLIVRLLHMRHERRTQARDTDLRPFWCSTADIPGARDTARKRDRGAASHGDGWATSTGHGADPTSPIVVLPSANRASPVLPFVAAASSATGRAVA